MSIAPLIRCQIFLQNLYEKTTFFLQLFSSCYELIDLLRVLLSLLIQSYEERKIEMP